MIAKRNDLHIDVVWRPWLIGATDYSSQPGIACTKWLSPRICWVIVVLDASMPVQARSKPNTFKRAFRRKGQEVDTKIWSSFRVCHGVGPQGLETCSRESAKLKSLNSSSQSYDNCPLLRAAIAEIY